MANITGGVPFIGFVAPTDSGDEYAVTNPLYGLGGLRTVADTTERDAIPDPRREQGMMVFSLADQKHYHLLGATANENWTVFSSGNTASFGITGQSGTGFTLEDGNVLGFTGDRTISVIINNTEKQIVIRGVTANDIVNDDQELVTNEYFKQHALIKTTSGALYNQMGVSLDMNTNSINRGNIDGGAF